MVARIEADYVIIGCGAAGMAFTDTLVRHSNATVAIIDRHHRPGGHWNDAYPFVQLHLPSHYYGVDSQPLGDKSLYHGGLNDGLLHMASGAEIVAYYDGVMERVLLASGRVTYLPMSNWEGEANVASLLTGERRCITLRKRVIDATFAATQVPSTHKRSFRVGHGVACIAINDLPRVERPPECYCVVGSGKTQCLLDSVHGVVDDQDRRDPGLRRDGDLLRRDRARIMRPCRDQDRRPRRDDPSDARQILIAKDAQNQDEPAPRERLIERRP